MGTWILILTLVTGEFRNTSSSMVQVTGFLTVESCMVAAKAWAAQAQSTTSYATPKALCVKA